MAVIAEDSTRCLIAEFTVKPGNEARVAVMMSVLTVDVRNEPGCLEFSPFTREGEPRHWVVIERYRDLAAFEAHISAPYGKVFNDELVTLIENAAGSTLTFLSPV